MSPRLARYEESLHACDDDASPSLDPRGEASDALCTELRRLQAQAREVEVCCSRAAGCPLPGLALVRASREKRARLKRSVDALEAFSAFLTTPVLLNLNSPGGLRYFQFAFNLNDRPARGDSSRAALVFEAVREGMRRESRDFLEAIWLRVTAVERRVNLPPSYGCTLRFLLVPQEVRWPEGRRLPSESEACRFAKIRLALQMPAHEVLMELGEFDVPRANALILEGAFGPSESPFSAELASLSPRRPPRVERSFERAGQTAQGAAQAATIVRHEVECFLQGLRATMEEVVEALSRERPLGAFASVAGWEQRFVLLAPKRAAFVSPNEDLLDVVCESAEPSVSGDVPPVQDWLLVLKA